MPTAWLISHQITNNLALVAVILTALWIVLMIGLLCEWICDIKVATWFLILVSETTIEEKEFDNALNVISSRFFM